jgi:hypothetical protein
MSLSTSVKRAIEQMPTTDLKILAGQSPSPTGSSLSTSVKEEIRQMPTTDLEYLAGLKKHHTNTTSSLRQRSTTSLKRQVGLKTSSLRSPRSSSLAMSPGQCPRGQVYHIQDGCISKHSHKSAHHHLVHKLHKANSK